MNIHGINEYSRNRGNNNQGNNQNNRMNFIGGASDGDPRQESFGKFIKDFCCPKFFLISVIFFISLIDLILYITTLCFGVQVVYDQLLAPKIDTLDTFGMKVNEK